MKIPTLSSDELATLLASLAVLLVFAFVFGRLFAVLKAPKVAGEIFGGFVISSVFYSFAPDFTSSLFLGFSSQGHILNSFYHLGLILLMFMAGFNTKLNYNKENLKLISLLFVGATLLPSLAGWFFIDYFRASFIGKNGNSFSFDIIFLISIAVTSIPVISKIFFDLNLMKTRFASIVLSMATIQDLFLWIFLNIAINYALGENNSLYNNLFTAFLTLALFIGIKPFSNIFSKLSKRFGKDGFYLLIFLSIFLSIFVLNKFGINPMYSAFLCGFFIKNISDDYEQIQPISDFAFAFFIPIYFALIGLNIHISQSFDFWFFVLFFVMAFGLEFLGIYISLLGLKIRQISKINFAITLNARGGPGIVLASVGLYYEIINTDFFATLIFTTLLSSIIAGYFLRIIKAKDIFDKF